MPSNAANSSGRRPTIKQVAKLANVAPATVSEVLNNRPTCWASQATRDRIIDVATRIGYRANPAARALRGKRTQTVGLIVPAFDSEMAARTFSAFESAAKQAGNLVFASTTKNQEDAEEGAICWMLDHQIDGLAVYPSKFGKHKILRELAGRGFPVTAIGAEGHLDFAVDLVMPDLYAGGRLQMRQLIDAGCRRIAYVASKQRCQVTNEKIRGATDAHRDAGLGDLNVIDVDLPNITEVQWQTDELQAITDAVRPIASDLDGIAFNGDLYAFASIRSLFADGVSIPEKLSVIGYDGIAIGGQAMVPLTTIMHPPELIGKGAFQLLDARLNAEAGRPENQQSRIPPILVKRRSVRT